MSATRPSRSAAFTLVELLVVIVIIGILVGLLLPAVNMVRDRATNAAMAVEINNLAQAVEAYRLKYGDYPPDFSDMEVVRRHVLQAWPNIASTELDVLANVTGFVDPAEALVFWLGGFSSDPQHPFTGSGGPIRDHRNDPTYMSGDPTYTINPDRQNGLYEFDAGRLTQEWLPRPEEDPTHPHRYLMSVEEDPNAKEMFLRTGPARRRDQDVFPVYMVRRRNTPFVYIDSRTYMVAAFPRAPFQGNNSNVLGVATAYLSDRARTATLFEFANPDTFQIICAGLDNHFGLGGTNRRYPSGTNYLTPGPGDDDNITNFSEGNKLQDSKP